MTATDQRPGRADHGALLVVLLLAVVPFLPQLFQPVEGGDAKALVMLGHFDNPEWFEWVFGQRHWIAYRPMFTASFLVTNALGGADWMHRVVNIALHAAAVWGVFALFKRLTGDSGRYAGLAAAVVALHPAAVEVALWLAHRSYAMCAAMGLWSLVLLLRSDEQKRTGLALLAGVLFSLSILANEVAAVFAVVAPPTLWVARPNLEDWRRRATALALFWLPMLPVLALRWRIVGGIGGYQRSQIVSVGPKGGRSVDFVDGVTGSRLAFESAWTYLIDPVPAWGRSLLSFSWFGLAVVGIWLTWALFGQRNRAVWMAAAWAMVCALLYAWTHTWFWRLGYGMTLPMGIAIAAALREGLAAGTSRLRFVHLFPVGLLLATYAANGPLNARHHTAISTPTYYDAAVQMVELVETPATVYLVLPHNADRAQSLADGLNLALHRQDVNFQVAACKAKPHNPEAPPLEGVVMLTETAQPGMHAHAVRDGKLTLNALPRRSKNHYVAWVTGTELHLHKYAPPP